MTAEPMVTRGAHYTALLDTIGHRGATKLHASEREQLLEAADVLLFGEADSALTVRSAEILIGALQTSERWSVESCDQCASTYTAVGLRPGHRKNRALGAGEPRRGRACPVGAVAGRRATTVR